MIRFFGILMLIATVASSAAEPIAPGAIEVIDGDTIRQHGRSVRLVGFDAPESGLRAQCESERTLAAKATQVSPSCAGLAHASTSVPLPLPITTSTVLISFCPGIGRPSLPDWRHDESDQAERRIRDPRI
jgi:hypothetical protein